VVGLRLEQLPVAVEHTDKVIRVRLVHLLQLVVVALARLALAHWAVQEFRIPL
jgi:hypothetical protein